MKHSVFSLFLSACCLLLAFVSCRPSAETTVVRQTPETPAGDTTEAAEPEEGDFQQLRIGELEPVSSLDPLHARNPATMRVLQLIYEGLVRYGPDGSLEPLLAREWEVENDSTLYRFSLRRDAFYHDSDIFGSGVGRRLHAGDVKFAIERMAWHSVSPESAQMFMNIEGYEPWFREQHRVFNPELRRLQGVRGIEIENDSTVTFRLIEPDPDFLEKLASPRAVIYPHETLQSPYPSRFRAVGTGPFAVNRQRGDSLFIFSRYENWHGEEPPLNRVDLIVFDNETDLFRSFASGEIQLIPQAGPQTLGTVASEDGTLSESYGEEYDLHRSDGRMYYSLHFNDSGPLSRAAADTLLQAVDSTIFGTDLYGLEFHAGNASPDTVENSMMPQGEVDSVYTTFDEDPWVRRFATRWAEQLRRQGVTLQMLPIRTHTRNISFYTESRMRLFRNDSVAYRSPPLLEFSVPAVALSHNRVERFRQNEFPWWFDLRRVEVPENLNASR